MGLDARIWMAHASLHTFVWQGCLGRLQVMFWLLFVILVVVVSNRTSGPGKLPCNRPRLPAASWLVFVNIKFLSRRLRSLPFTILDGGLQCWRKRPSHVLRLWPIVAAAREADRRANASAFMSTTLAGWHASLTAWRNHVWRNHWQTIICLDLFVWMPCMCTFRPDTEPSAGHNCVSSVPF